MNLRNPKEYIQNFIYIRDKQQRLVRLLLKPSQEKFYEIIRKEHQAGKPVRLIVLKGRQMGISTVTEALMFQDAATRPMVNTMIVAHRDEATANLFRMNKLFYDCLPAAIQPMRKNSNAKELVFENPTMDPAAKRRNPGLRSRIKCVTAGGKGAGRSDTLTNVHLSEFAFWPGDKMGTLAGIMQAVPNDPDTMVVIESTANGFNEFKDLWDGAVAGTNGWLPVFLPWYDDPTYRLPVTGNEEWTEEEERLRSQFGLDDEQLAWRRWCIRVNMGGDEKLFRQEYPNTPDEAFLLSGDPFFDNDTVMARRMAATEPVMEGLFEFREPEFEGGAPADWKFLNRSGGCIRIFELPEPGVPYVLGGDTAGEGSDRFTAHVLDNRDGHQVAELQLAQSEIVYARQIFCLGHFYNTALVAVEVNFSTYPEMKLEEWHYPRLYQRERFDTFANRMVKSLGWVTSPKTRPVILAGLHTVMEEAPELIVSFQLLGEMLCFVYGKNRKPQAAEGEHDDLVLAAAIAHGARSQQTYTAAESAGDRKNWTADMWEDYRAADPETKKILEERWRR